MQVSSQIERFAKAIARAEGFGIPDAIPTRAHNPGDLVIPGSTNRIGEGITVFASDEEGWNALYHQLGLIAIGHSHVYSPSMTILEMAEKWTATVSQQQGWATNVAAYLGVPITTTLQQVFTT
jgi:hypothetical protein